MLRTIILLASLHKETLSTCRFYIRRHRRSRAYATWLLGFTRTGLSPASLYQLFWARGSQRKKMRSVQAYVSYFFTKKISLRIRITEQHLLASLCRYAFESHKTHPNSPQPSAWSATHSNTVPPPATDESPQTDPSLQVCAAWDGSSRSISSERTFRNTQTVPYACREGSQPTVLRCSPAHAPA